MKIEKRHDSGSRLDLPRDLLFDTLANTAVIAPAHAAKTHDYAPQFRVRPICEATNALTVQDLSSTRSHSAVESSVAPMQ